MKQKAASENIEATQTGDCRIIDGKLGTGDATYISSLESVDASQLLQVLCYGRPKVIWHPAKVGTNTVFIQVSVFIDIFP